MTPIKILVLDKYNYIYSFIYVYVYLHQAGKTLKNDNNFLDRITKTYLSPLASILDYHHFGLVFYNINKFLGLNSSNN